MRSRVMAGLFPAPTALQILPKPQRTVHERGVRFNDPEIFRNVLQGRLGGGIADVSQRLSFTDDFGMAVPSLLLRNNKVLS